MEGIVMYLVIVVLTVLGSSIRAVYWIDDNRKKPKKERKEFDKYMLARSIFFGTLGVILVGGANQELGIVSVAGDLGLVLVIPVAYFGESIVQKTLKKLEEKL